MRLVSKLYHTIVSSSPVAEIAMRKLYWTNVRRFEHFRISNHVPRPNQKIDFDKIIDCLRCCGVKTDDIIVVHSAYSPFKGQYTGEDIIERLLNAVPFGTIAMPAIRHYPEDEPYEDYINQSFEGMISMYDVHNTKITSGYLPYLMTKDPRAHISRCPHNPLVAIGINAEEMMKGNIDMDFITAHGTGSCWDYCVKHDAWNMGLGIPIEGFLTIFHNMQECGDWPVLSEAWFFPRQFMVRDGDFERQITFQERVHKWTMYYAETNFNNDMIADGVIKQFNVDGVPILMTKTSELWSFIHNKMKKNPTYPYLIPRKYLKK